VATFTNLLNRSPPSFSLLNEPQIPLSHASLVQEVATEGCKSWLSATLLCGPSNEGDDEDAVDALLQNAEFRFIPAVWRPPIPPTNSPLSTSPRRDMANISRGTYSRAFCCAPNQSSSPHSALDEDGVFQRVDSKPNLVSRPSMLTRSSNSPLVISPSKHNAQKSFGGSLEEKVELANDDVAKDEIQECETDSQNDYTLPMEYRRADGTRYHRDRDTKGSWEVLATSSDTSSSEEVDNFVMVRESSQGDRAHSTATGDTVQFIDSFEILTPAAAEPETHIVQETNYTRPPTSNTRHGPESSAPSTVDGTVPRSGILEMSPPHAFPISVDRSSSIVRGFTQDHVSPSARSLVQLAPAQISQLNALGIHPTPEKQAATFMLGGSSSSGEGDESFLDSQLLGTGISLAPIIRQITSFDEEVATQTLQDRPYESEEVFENTDDEDESQSKSAIDDEEWEDDDEPTSSPSLDEKDMFQRVDSKPKLVSRRSILTSLMHEKDRAGALLQNANSSSPANRRSRKHLPNGPLDTSAPRSIAQGLPQPSRARPVIMTTPNTHHPALSPRTTRRNMLSTELTESLRKHLLWERQVSSSTTNAALKRRHTAHDMKNIQHYPSENYRKTILAPVKVAQATNSWNKYFEAGLLEYHQKGW
jgi:hypothetical protein